MRRSEGLKMFLPILTTALLVYSQYALKLEMFVPAFLF
ncbi:hypothetical protein HMPREF9966_1869 [Streptococcus anginosus SK52 = DSM 20563]|nr:hypothetical protein HMPREF9966_1869 [Streptococcus anginosus SK52 = DSM 20563]